MNNTTTSADKTMEDADSTHQKDTIETTDSVRTPSPSDASTEIEATEKEEAVIDISQGIFQKYRCKSLSIGQEHPGNISESRLLSSINLPQCTYPSDAFDGDLIDSGKLSNLQLEGILYACQQHQELLPTGERRGFFLGDGTGVGKGRQLAGIIFDNLCRGRKKHIWLSVSTDLKCDAERDLRDLNCHVPVIDGCKQLDSARKGLGLSSSAQSGVLFLTYSTLTSSMKAKNSRLNQILSWCGKDFDGCLLFDECHKAKNCSEATTKKGGTVSQVSKAVGILQSKLPQARVVYCSATGVSGVGELGYMCRLGLWGPHTSFKDFDELFHCISNRGLGALEMLAMQLKLQGKFISRGLSYEGAEFSMATIELTPVQRQAYAAATCVWKKLQVSIAEALVRTQTPAGIIWRNFWSSHQRFFRQLIMGIKAPFIAQQVRQALSDGHCVIIGLQTTGEASVERLLDEQQGTEVYYDELISLCQRILLDFVVMHFPTIIQPREKRHYAEPIIAANAARARLIEQGETNKVLLQKIFKDTLDRATTAKIAIERENTIADQQVGQVHSESLAQQQQFLSDIRAIEGLPANPLDLIIDKCGGPDEVAELTGRKRRLQRIHHGEGSSKFVFFNRYNTTTSGSNADKLNITEQNHFMNGTKRVAIISDAASTGISLHADARSNTCHRRRVHITLELPWSAEKAIQQLGRSHRSNQVSAPLYILATTELGGENSFVSRVAMRIQSLGAIMKGDRRAGAGQDFTAFNFDTKYGTEAVKSLLQSVSSHSSLVIGVKFSDVFALLPPNVQSKCSTEATKMTSTDDHVDLDPAKSLEQKQIQVMNALFFGPAMRQMGLVMETNSSSARNSTVKVFLNRILGLEPECQNAVFGYFGLAIKAVIAQAKQEGKYDEGFDDIRGRNAILVNNTQLFHDPQTQCTVSHAQVKVDRGLNWHEVLDIYNTAVAAAKAQSGSHEKEEEHEHGEEVEHEHGVEHENEIEEEYENEIEEEHENKNKKENKKEEENEEEPTEYVKFDDQHMPHFGVSKSKLFGQFQYLLMIPRPRGYTCTIIRPNTGWSYVEHDIADIYRKYRFFRCPDAAAAGWTHLFNHSKSSCIHFSGCKLGSECKTGRRLMEYSVLNGSLLSVWSIFDQVVMKGLGAMTQRENHHVVRIVRITLETDKRLVGLNFPPELLSDLEAVFQDKQQQLVKSTFAPEKLNIVEKVTPIDAKASVRATKLPTTMKSFFSPKPSFKSMSSSSSSFGGKKRRDTRRASTPNKTPKVQSFAPTPVMIDLASSSSGDEL